MEVADLDTAISWSARAPSAAWGEIEIRPSATRYVEGAWQGTPPVD